MSCYSESIGRAVQFHAPGDQMIILTIQSFPKKYLKVTSGKISRKQAAGSSHKINVENALYFKQNSHDTHQQPSVGHFLIALPFKEPWIWTR